MARTSLPLCVAHDREEKTKTAQKVWWPFSSILQQLRQKNNQKKKKKKKKRLSCSNSSLCLLAFFPFPHNRVRITDQAPVQRVCNIPCGECNLPSHTCAHTRTHTHTPCSASVANLARISATLFASTPCSTSFLFFLSLTLSLSHSLTLTHSLSHSLTHTHSFFSLVCLPLVRPRLLFSSFSILPLQPSKAQPSKAQPSKAQPSKAPVFTSLGSSPPLFKGP